MVAAFGTVPSSLDQTLSQQTIVEQLTPNIALAPQAFDDTYFVREDRVQRGDSISSLLARLEIQDETAFRFLRENPSTQIIFRQLRPGKTITAHVGVNGELKALIFPLNSTDLATDQALFIERRDGQLRTYTRALPLERQVQMKSGEIRQSLFGATDDADIPDQIALQMADIFGGDIDFHTDLRRGDRFSVVYETLHHLGKPVRTGRILAAEFVNDGHTYRATWFAAEEGRGAYYTPEGKSLRKAFLRSPLEFSRVSSGFTMARYHPIQNRWRAHKGVDYAAPTGTRIKASSDGVVEFIGNQGGYGKVIILRHQGKYTTLYGHLSGFANGLHTGDRVSQGEIIGYVGSTGWSTGPHLHYEFRINGVHQNPLSVALPTEIPLAPQQLTAFRMATQPYLARIDLLKDSNLALLD